MILDPIAAYVIKTVDTESGQKVFINVCTDPQIHAPDTLEASEIAMRVIKGEDWVVPIVVSTGRTEKDKAGDSCFAADCCMNPAVVMLGIEDPDVKLLTIETCVEIVEDRFNCKLSRDFKFPRLKSKGTLERTQVDTDMPHPSPNDKTGVAQLVKESQNLKMPTQIPSKKPSIEVVSSSEEVEPQVRVRPYPWTYHGPGPRPSHLLEVEGEYHDLRIVKSVVKLGPYEHDLGFQPAKINAFYFSKTARTCVVIWKTI